MASWEQVLYGISGLQNLRPRGRGGAVASPYEAMLRQLQLQQAAEELGLRRRGVEMEEQLLPYRIRESESRVRGAELERELANIGLEEYRAAPGLFSEVSRAINEITNQRALQTAHGIEEAVTAPGPSDTLPFEPALDISRPTTVDELVQAGTSAEVLARLQRADPKLFASLGLQAPAEAETGRLRKRLLGIDPLSREGLAITYQLGLRDPSLANLAGGAQKMLRDQRLAGLMAEAARAVGDVITPWTSDLTGKTFPGVPPREALQAALAHPKFAEIFMDKDLAELFAERFEPELGLKDLIDQLRQAEGQLGMGGTMRPTITYTPEGKPRLTLTENAPSIDRRLLERAEEKFPGDRDKQLEWIQDMKARGAGLTAAAQAGSRPLDAADKQALQSYDTTLAALEQLKTFTPEEIRNYTGLLNKPAQEVKAFIQSLPVVGGAFGTPDERYQQFAALMGRLKGTAFGEGGKQLTGFEAQVVFSYTPTGTEPGGAPQMLAKARQLEAFMRLARSLRLRLAKSGKGEIDPAEFDALLQTAMEQTGMPIPGRGAAAPGAAAPAATTPSPEHVVPSQPPADVELEIGPTGICGRSRTARFRA